ncbi:MAG: hypothetical protein JRF02_02325 [Deltaproteobacteria bacterium]|jgi:hypothetical protein|nr:hypothetical protein [Deltaproteobacteria bacterium]
MGNSSRKQANYESVEDLFDDQVEASAESQDINISNRDNNRSTEDLFGEQIEVSDKFVSKGDSFDSIEDLFGELTGESGEYEDVSISSCVYEPVLVGLKEKKLESRLEKSFYPQYDAEITVIDAEDNSVIIPIEDLQFLAFVNIPLQIDLLKINNFSEVVETFSGDSFKVRIPDGQDFDTGFFGLIENPEDRYKYIFLPHNNIRIQYQQRPIGDIFVEKKFLSVDTLNNVLNKQRQLRSLRLGSIIAKRASLRSQHVEKTLQEAWQKRPDKKLRLEQERLKKESIEKLLRGKRRLQKEADEKLRVEEERLQKEADEKLLQRQEELSKELEEKKKTEEERLKKEIDEKLLQEQEELQKEMKEKLRLEEERLKKEMDAKLLEREAMLRKKVGENKTAEKEQLKKDIAEKLIQIKEELQKEVKEKKEAEKERLKSEIEKELLEEKEKLRELANKKLQLEAEWLKLDTVEKHPTGDVLIESGLVSPDVVKQSLAIQKKMRKMKLGELFIEMGVINEDQMCKVLAEKFNKRFVDLQKTTPTDEALEYLSRDFIKKLEIIPIHIKNERLVIATSNPDSGNLSDILQEKLSCPFELVISPRSQIIETLSNLPA